MDIGEIRGVPILAFPQTVFFPQTALDWAVRPGQLADMFQEAHASGAPIGIFRAKPANGDEGSLPCERIGTIGGVSELAREGGAINVTFFGHYCADILKLTPSEPLNMADVQRRAESLEVSSTDDLMVMIYEAESIFKKLNPYVRDSKLAIPPDDELQFLFAALVNSIAAYLPSPPNLKQAWLEEANLNERYALVKGEIVRLSALDDLVNKAPKCENPELN